MEQPKQERSRRSLDLFVEAADGLASEKGFESMTLREVCQRAALTSGAFYARFSRKEDLALVLAQRLGDEILEMTKDFPEQLAAQGFSPAMGSLLSQSIELYRRRAGLFRALIAQAQTHSEVALAMRQTNDRVFKRLQVALSSRAEMTHPSPRLALSLGLVTVFNALRELVLEQKLFEEQPFALDDEVLVAELLRMLTSYLGIESQQQMDGFGENDG